MTTPNRDASAASIARSRAEQRLAQTESQWAMIHAVTDPLRQRREENHFADLFRAAFSREVR